MRRKNEQKQKKIGAPFFFSSTHPAPHDTRAYYITPALLVFLLLPSEPLVLLVQAVLDLLMPRVLLLDFLGMSHLALVRLSLSYAATQTHTDS